mmetsp:Transcript_28909/g.46793  ORF Transcript_28909/g.46793 Transcript_28909/m.46793 type:complete len:623 (+) Transcript_28909:105-1973(+)
MEVVPSNVSEVVPPVSLSWRDVDFFVPTKTKKPTDNDSNGEKLKRKYILSKITGIAKPGEMVAILGPSGSGKTALLKVLANRISSSSTTGDILVNGSARKSSAFKKVSAYVAYDNVYYGVLTVRETLMYSARLNLPSSVSKTEKADRVQKLLVELGLEVCANTKIGNVFYRGISGGQKRRVAIGIELITDPSIMFCDEPTTGLDSHAAQSIAELLKSLALQGRTLICTLQQPEPEVISQFDTLSLLSEGRVAYYGPVKEMVPFFTSLNYPCPPFVNPTDHYMTIVNLDFAEEEQRPKAQERLNEIFEQTAQGTYVKNVLHEIEESKSVVAESAVADTPPQGTTSWEQFSVLMHRNTKNYLLNPAAIYVRLILAISIAIVFGTMSGRLDFSPQRIFDRIYGIAFFPSFNCFMTLAIVPAFLEDLAVYKREHGNASVKVLPWVAAITVASLPWTLLITFVSGSVYYPIINLNPTGEAYGYYMLLFFVCYYSAESIVLVCSALVPIMIIAMALGAFIFGFWFVDMGIFIFRTSIPWFWRVTGYYPGTFSWMLSGFLTNDFLGNTFDTDAFCVINGGPTGCTTTGQDIITYLQIPDISKWWMVAIVVLQLVFFRFALYLTMKVVRK